MIEAVVREPQKPGAGSPVDVLLTDTDYPELEANLTFSWSPGYPERFRLTSLHLSVRRTRRRRAPGEPAFEPDRGPSADLQLTAGAVVGSVADDTGEDTAFDLRRFPWARWEKAARAAVVDWHGARWPSRPQPLEGARDEKLERVAEEYRANLRSGVRDPAGAIAREHGVASQTVRVWLMEARKRGILGPARSRTAGETALPRPQVDSETRTSGRASQPRDRRRR